MRHAVEERACGLAFGNQAVGDTLEKLTLDEHVADSRLDRLGAYWRESKRFTLRLHDRNESRNVEDVSGRAHQVHPQDSAQ